MSRIVTTTTLIAPTTASSGEELLLEALVTASGETPDGMVSFLDGDTVLGTSDVDASGLAGLTFVVETPGMRTFSARFEETERYGESVSSSVAMTVAPASFTVSVSRAPVFGEASGPGNAQLLVTVRGQLAEEISFSCVGDSPSVSCSFSPSTVPGTAGATTVEVTLSSKQAHRSLPIDLGGSPLAWGWLLPPGSLE